MKIKNNECNYNLEVYEDYIFEEIYNDLYKIMIKLKEFNKNFQENILPTKEGTKLCDEMAEIAENLNLKTLERLSRL